MISTPLMERRSVDRSLRCCEDPHIPSREPERRNAMDMLGVVAERL